jgi:uncharacterized protein (TIGR02246 family)
MTTTPPMTTPEMLRAIAAVQQDWNQAGSSWSPDALAAVYTNEAVFFGGRPGHSVGQDAIRSYFASYGGVIERGQMTWVDPQCLELDAESFLAQGYVDFAFTLAGGCETRSRLRATWVIVRTVSGLRIRLHHFSPTPDVPPLGDR